MLDTIIALITIIAQLIVQVLSIMGVQVPEEVLATFLAFVTAVLTWLIGRTIKAFRDRF